MTRETQTERPGSSFFRTLILTGVGLSAALLVPGFVRFPGVFVPALQTIVFLTITLGLLAIYCYLALRRTTTETAYIQSVALYPAGWLGLALGALWLVELWAGNLSSGFPEGLVQFAYRGPILAVPVLTGVVAFLAARRTGSRQVGIWIGLWSGMISSLMVFIGLSLIGYSGALLHDPQTIQDAARAGAANLADYAVTESLAGAINHLWIGPAIGILFGALGSTLGNSYGAGAEAKV